MKNKFVFLLLTFAASTITQTINASETADSLHESKCLGCHDSEAYTRKEKTVKSLSALSQRVRICTKQAAKANWSDSQMDKVTEYLNTRYYKF